MGVNTPTLGIFSPEEANRIARAKRPAVLMHAPTHFVTEPAVEQEVAALLSRTPSARPTILWCDPGETRDTFLGYPARQLRHACAREHDLTVVATRVAAPAFYHFLTRSRLDVPEVLAPGLPGGMHRTFLRRVVLALRKRAAPTRVLEIGCIEGVHGGCFTSLGLAENLRSRDVLFGMDRNPYSLELARYFCQGQRPRHTLIHADVFDAISRSDLPHGLDLVLEHVWSDCPENTELLRRLHQGLTPFLAPEHSLLMLSRDTPDAVPGSFQEYLTGLGYVREDSLLETETPRRRFLVWMRTAPSPRGKETDHA